MSEYNSFYGGRRGASFVIVKKYSTIKEMVEEFSKGGDYKTVNYDEYVLIDTVSKNDADNGKVYRRGYEYNNNMGGAIYIGQIVGPGGLAPHLEMKTIDEVQNIQQRDNFTYRRGTGNYSPIKNLVPGKYTDSNGAVQYNDSITWAYCSVRDQNATDTTAHIGFKVPYTVIEYKAESVDSYYNRDKAGKDFKNTNLITRKDDGSHPFFAEWGVKIPKGIKGDAFKNLRVVTANANIQAYDGQDDDIKNNRQVLVYTYYNYDSNASGDPVDIYLGDYNIIKDIVFDNDGTIHIKYSHDSDKVLSKKIKWVDSVSMNKATGQLVMHYNNGTTQTLNESINYIQRTACSKDTGFHLYILYSDSTMQGNITYDGVSGWVDLGFVGTGNIGCIAAKENDTTAANLIKDLPPYSTWMIIED